MRRHEGCEDGHDTALFFRVAAGVAFGGAREGQSGTNGNGPERVRVQAQRFSAQV